MSESVSRSVVSDSLQPRQAPLSMGFSRQEYWSGFPLPSPGDLPNLGIKPGSPELQADSLPSKPTGSPICNSNDTHLSPRYILKDGWFLSTCWCRGGMRRPGAKFDLNHLPWMRLGRSLLLRVSLLTGKSGNKGFPMAQTVKNLPAMQETRV